MKPLEALELFKAIDIEQKGKISFEDWERIFDQIKAKQISTPVKSLSKDFRPPKIESSPRLKSTDNFSCKLVWDSNESSLRLSKNKELN